VTEKCVLGFVHWLVLTRNLKASSVNGYLSGIRKLHVVKGAALPEIRSELVCMVLDGVKNMDSMKKLTQVHQERQPVTADIMKLLKVQFTAWDADPVDRLTAWLVCSLLFHAACRGGELLCRTVENFDPAVNLLRRDLFLTQEPHGKRVLQLKIKAPKENKDNRAVIIDVFESGLLICPIKAFVLWERANVQ